VSVVELHPEDLLDRDARGELADGDRARLVAHLARCAACRFERTVRADFAGELRDTRGDALTPAEQIVAMVEGKLPKPEVSADDADALPLTRRPAFLRRSARVWAFAAAALLVGSVAGAGITTFRPAAPAPSVVRLPAWSRFGVLEEPSHLAAVVRRATPRPVSVPEVVEPAPTASGSPATSDAPAGARAAALPQAREGGAAALFDAASEAQRRGDYARAVELSRELQARYPASREAHVSFATMGQLLLDRGDARGALGSMDAYATRGHDQLDEPAMVGRARALERLGRADEARAAWAALLAAFPNTPYAAYARGRLDGPERNR
jgi:hypothetical protein